MKKPSIMCGMALILALTSGHAFAISFGLDVNGDGVVDDPAEITISTSDTVEIDIYLVDWPTTVNLGALDYTFHWDTTKMDLTDYDPNLKATGGPWDMNGEYPDIDYIDFSLVEFALGVPGPQILLHTVVLHCIAEGDGNITVDNGYLADVAGNDFYDVDDANGIIHQGGCIEDADCDDGLFCNGVEFCVVGSCQQGTDPCPGLLCNEDTDSCESVPATTTTTTGSQTTTTLTPITTTTTSTIRSDTDTTTTTTTAKCLFKEIYGGDSEEAELLRRFRDNALSQTHEGREIIKLYYQWSPAITKAMMEDEEFKEAFKAMIDEVLGLVKYEGDN